MIDMNNLEQEGEKKAKDELDQRMGKSDQQGQQEQPDKDETSAE